MSKYIQHSYFVFIEILLVISTDLFLPSLHTYTSCIPDYSLTITISERDNSCGRDLNVARCIIH